MFLTGAETGEAVTSFASPPFFCPELELTFELVDPVVWVFAVAPGIAEELPEVAVDDPPILPAGTEPVLAPKSGRGVVG